MADANVLEYDYLNKEVLKYLLIKIHNELIASRISYGDTTVGDELDDINELLEQIDQTLQNVAKLDGAIFTGPITVPEVPATVTDNTVVTAAYVVEAIKEALKDISGIDIDGPYTSLADLIEKVPDPKKGVIYLVSNSGSAPNSYDEYYWNSKTNEFEMFGTTAVDLSGYVKKTDMYQITTEDIDILLKQAGFNIP